MAPLSEPAAEQMQEAGVLRQLKQVDAVWATEVLRVVVQDNVRMLQAVEEQLGQQLRGCEVTRTPPTDERRELLYLLTDAARGVPQGCAQVSQHRLEMAWLEPDTLPMHARPRTRPDR